MANSDFFRDMVTQALIKSLRQGGSTFLEEIAETLTPVQLEGLIGILQKVKNKKTTTIDVKVTPNGPTRR